MTAAPIARAQLRDPVSADLVGDGSNLRTAASVLGEASSQRDAGLAVDLAAVLSWTRSGVDDTQGFRGPRWTNRWGLAVEGRASAGTGDRPLVVEHRAELALYALSIGETVTWGAPPHITDPLWRRDAHRAVFGAFVDFPGLGLVRRDGGDVVACEAIPVALSVTGDRDIRTVEFEAAAVRVTGSFGDVRVIDHRVTVRDQLDLKSIAWDFSAFSVRDAAIRPGSPWRLSGAIGLGIMTPFKPDSDDRFAAPASVVPLARLGIAHHGAAVLRAARSEIGRPLLEDLDFGAEIGTLHRLIDERGLDAGAQLTAWIRRALAPGVVLRAESMLGVGGRLYHRDMEVWVRGGGAIWLARSELSLAVELSHGVGIEAGAALEHSERTDPSAAPRWFGTLQSGLVWRQ